MSASFLLLREAIAKKQWVIADYNGYRREMCPHTLGWKNGREMALLYQFGGGSSSGLDPVGSPSNWRCVFVDRLSNVEVRDGAWFTASNHSRKQTCVDQVDSAVAV
jgi:hypothetical protein